MVKIIFILINYAVTNHKVQLKIPFIISSIIKAKLFLVIGKRNSWFKKLEITTIQSDFHLLINRMSRGF